MRNEVQEDGERSRRDFVEVVWPQIRDALGGGRLESCEGRTNKTERDLDIVGGIDAHQIIPGRGMRGIASRVQWVDRSYDTLTQRYSRATGVETEYPKRIAAAESGWTLPMLTIHSYVHHEKRRLVAVAIVYTRDLYAHLVTCRHQHKDFAADRSARCYYGEVKDRGAARFVAVPWHHLKDAGVRHCVIRGHIDPPWEWTHLGCDRAWPTEQHGQSPEQSCPGPLAHAKEARSYWIRRLRLAVPDASSERLAELVDKPIARSELIRLFGKRWSSKHDAGRASKQFDQADHATDLVMGGR